MLSCQYIPPKTKKKPKLHKITASGVDVLKRELSEKAGRRQFLFSLMPKINDWLQVQVVDGKGKTNILEIYDALGNIKTCTCKEYFEQEGSWCVHLAALNGIEKLGWSKDTTVKTWLYHYAKARITVPMHPRMYKSGAMFYDSLSETAKSIGKAPLLPTDNWNAYIKYKKNTPVTTVTQMPTPAVMPSSAGLLGNGISLYPYQEDIFQKMLLSKRAICSMVMGSGKTLTTIACYAKLLQSKPKLKKLVIAPKSLCLQWISEIKRATGIDAKFIRTPEDIKQIYKNPGVYVSTYQYTTRHIEEFKKYDYDLLVVDEIQFVKNNDTKTWRAISQLNSEYFFGLSGTVIENRLDDFYAIMQIISPNTLGPRWKFNHLFQNVLMLGSSKVVYTGVKNLPLLKSKVQNHVFFYDKIVLPPISHQFSYVKCNTAEKQVHDEYKEKARLLIAKSMNSPLTRVEKMLLQAFLLKARQAANAKELITKNIEPRSNKIVEYLNILGQVVSRQEKLVVFSEWTEYLAIAKRESDALGIKSVMFTGAQDMKARSKAVSDFQNDPTITLFYASDAGGVGLDGLQLVANNVLHLELPWNPSKLDQRTGRVYRLLQTKPVTAYYLVSNDTIENSIENLLTSKRDIRTQTLQNFV